MPRPDFVFLDDLPASVQDRILEDRLSIDDAPEPGSLGLAPRRWAQIADLFVGKRGHDVLVCLGRGFSTVETACLLARTERRVRGIARGFINNLRESGMPRDVSMPLDLPANPINPMPTMRRPTRAGRKRGGGLRAGSGAEQMTLRI